MAEERRKGEGGGIEYDTEKATRTQQLQTKRSILLTGLAAQLLRTTRKLFQFSAEETALREVVQKRTDGFHAGLKHTASTTLLRFLSFSLSKKSRMVFKNNNSIFTQKYCHKHQTHSYKFILAHHDDQ